MKSKILIEFEIEDENPLFDNIKVDCEYSFKQKMNSSTLKNVLAKVFDTICNDQAQDNKKKEIEKWAIIHTTKQLDY